MLLSLFLCDCFTCCQYQFTCVLTIEVHPSFRRGPMALVEGGVTFRNPYGFIPAELFGFLPFEVRAVTCAVLRCTLCAISSMFSRTLRAFRIVACAIPAGHPPSKRGHVTLDGCRACIH